MMVSSRRRPIEIANCGMPCRKLVVPSKGSTIQVWLLSEPSRLPPSSPMKPYPGRALARSSYSISSARLSALVTKFAGPFSDTCRCSISPRSRLRLRPARRAAFTMTLIRAEYSMMRAYGMRERPNAVRGLGTGLPCRRAVVKASFAGGGTGGAGPFLRGRFDLGAVLGAELRQPLVEFGVALAGGLGDKMPLQAFDLVHRHPQAAHQHAGKAVLRDRRVLP